MKNKKIILLFAIFTISLIISMLINQATSSLIIDPQKVKAIITIKTFLIIVLKNSMVFLFILSAFILGNSVIYLTFIVNGFLIGETIAKLTWSQALLLLVPHGIFEFFSYFWLASIILNRIGKSQIQGSMNVNRDTHRTIVHRILNSYFLLILAALIETFITPLIIIFF